MKLERKVYPDYAGEENERKKAEINREIYKEIKDKAELKLVKRGYHEQYYHIVSNPENLSYDKLALIADSGNLCFGYRLQRLNGMTCVVIYTD